MGKNNSNLHLLIEKKREELIKRAAEETIANREQRESIRNLKNDFINDFFHTTFLDNFESFLINTIENCVSVDKLNYLKILFSFPKCNTHNNALAYSGINYYVPADNTCIEFLDTTMSRDLYDEVMTYIKNVCLQYDLRAYSEASYVPTENAKLSIYGEAKSMADMIYNERHLYQEQENKTKTKRKVD